MHVLQNRGATGSDLARTGNGGATEERADGSAAADDPSCPLRIFALLRIRGLGDMTHTRSDLQYGVGQAPR